MVTNHQTLVALLGGEGHRSLGFHTCLLESFRTFVPVRTGPSTVLLVPTDARHNAHHSPIGGTRKGFVLNDVSSI